MEKFMLAKQLPALNKSSVDEVLTTVYKAVLDGSGEQSKVSVLSSLNAFISAFYKGYSASDKVILDTNIRRCTDWYINLCLPNLTTTAPQHLIDVLLQEHSVSANDGVSFHFFTGCEDICMEEDGAPPRIRVDKMFPVKVRHMDNISGKECETWNAIFKIKGLPEQGDFAELLRRVIESNNSPLYAQIVSSDMSTVVAAYGDFDIYEDLFCSVTSYPEYSEGYKQARDLYMSGDESAFEKWSQQQTPEFRWKDGWSQAKFLEVLLSGGNSGMNRMDFGRQ